MRDETRAVDDGWAQLTIEDDGRGFSPDHVDRSSHFGLQLLCRSEWKRLVGNYRYEASRALKRP